MVSLLTAANRVFLRRGTLLETLICLEMEPLRRLRRHLPSKGRYKCGKNAARKKFVNYFIKAVILSIASASCDMDVA